MKQHECMIMTVTTDKTHTHTIFRILELLQNTFGSSVHSDDVLWRHSALPILMQLNMTLKFYQTSAGQFALNDDFYQRYKGGKHMNRRN